jgi:hypothetical protein
MDETSSVEKFAWQKTVFRRENSENWVNEPILREEPTDIATLGCRRLYRLSAPDFFCPNTCLYKSVRKKIVTFTLKSIQMDCLTRQNFYFFSCYVHWPSSTTTKAPPSAVLFSADHSCLLAWLHPMLHAREAQYGQQPTFKALGESLPSLWVWRSVQAQVITQASLKLNN